MASTKDDKIPEPGDLIEISRSGFQHWAIYIGDGCVVHFSQPIECAPDGSCTQGGLLSEVAQVKMEKLSHVVGKDKYRINNRLDDQYDVQPISLIIERAMTLLGERFTYNVLTSNCEHFATQMRYGYPESCQADHPVASLFGMIIFGLAGKPFVPCLDVKKKKI